ncbi:MAG: rod shape-determining protein RodA [Candidatus Paceibacterota bacterium]|jgi:rod shape determining protein RodA
MKFFESLIYGGGLSRIISKPNIDWWLLGAVVPLLAAGLTTMNSFTGEGKFFEHQLVWIGLAFLVMFFLAFNDFRFLRRTSVIVTLFIGIVFLLLALFAVGSTFKGAQSWFDIGGFSFQPSDLAKLVLILLLAKYFSRRHIEIANIRHILVSGFYAMVLFLLVLFQPDFGGAIVIFLIWLGMVLVSGISKKHLALVFVIGAIAFGGLWTSVFKEYQKQRILTFIHPLTDIQGAGYNAYQSTIAVGSGGLLGKGIGYGTQSKLKFLPEYQTDFIFAAFAEEWGFVGVVLLLILFGIVIWRVLANAIRGATNFEVLYCVGVAILFTSHFIIHVGMNIGLLPVTGLTMPFLSYGGTHLVIEFTALGILFGMRRYQRASHKDEIKNEFIGPN